MRRMRFYVEVKTHRNCAMVFVVWRPSRTGTQTKRGKILDADRLTLSDERRCVLRTKLQCVPRQETAAIRRVIVGDAG